MSAPTNLPIDFVDYLCAERAIARDEALDLLAAHVRELSPSELELSRSEPAALPTARASKRRS